MCCHTKYNEEPVIEVGIMQAPEIDVDFSSAGFTLHGVTIGIDFHWQQKRDLTFAGSLKLKHTSEGVVAINRVGVEEYLRSVISSEMSAEASPELLKAHAVISRSWLLAQMEARAAGGRADKPQASAGDRELIRWWDREDHTLFDVCADDHCQRYQGVTNACRQAVVDAVDATRGMVLTDDLGNLCDARFSKCCGGAMEEFGACWSSDERHPYLQALRDTAQAAALPDLRREDEAAGWIGSRPDAFCARATERTLRQVLNDYDQATRDFYRWKVTYSRDELSALVARKLPEFSLGEIIELHPVERGRSGRIVRLLIKGTSGEAVIGKELMIRRTLSETHLYSSAFVVEPHEADASGLPAGFTIRGAGWGHGVGLCQIGAAVMGEEGYGFRDILAHYFPGSEISKLYD